MKLFLNVLWIFSLGNRCSKYCVIYFGVIMGFCAQCWCLGFYFLNVRISRDTWSVWSQLAWKIMELLTKKIGGTSNHNFTEIMMSLGTLRQWHHVAVGWPKIYYFLQYSNLFIISTWTCDNYQYCHNILWHLLNHLTLPNASAFWSAQQKQCHFL